MHAPVADDAKQRVHRDCAQPRFAQFSSGTRISISMRVAARRWAAPILGALVGAVGPAWTRAEERPASLGPRVARVRSHEVPIPTSVDSRETMQALLREDRDDVPYLARRPLLICSGNSNRNLAGHIGALGLKARQFANRFSAQ